MKINLAVLLTVYNRKDKTLQCLRNLFSQQLPDNCNITVYLTDDGCTDGTPEAVAAEFPKVNIIQGDGSLFWNRGMYAAWTEAEKCNFDYYLWLNDDTFIYNDCLSNLLKEATVTDNKAIIVGATLDSKKTKVTYSGWYAGKLIDPRKDNRKAQHFNGNIVLIPRYVYHILGKNDSYYRHALGDFDYGLRASKKGISNIVCPEICGICDDHPNMPKWKNPEVPLKQRFKAMYSVGGNGANPIEFFYFKRRHYGLLAAVITFCSNFIHVTFPGLWKLR